VLEIHPVKCVRFPGTDRNLKEGKTLFFLSQYMLVRCFAWLFVENPLCYLERFNSDCNIGIGTFIDFF
jgi:hypothetical protein